VVPSPKEQEKRPRVFERERQRADVDGDGSADRVELVKRGWVRGGEVRAYDVTVRLAGGAQTFELQMPGGLYPQLRPSVDVDGDGDREVIVAQESGDSAQLQVFTFADGLVLARKPADPPLASGWDEQSRTHRTYTEGGRLYTWRDPLPWANDRMAEELRVDTWRWTLDGIRLVAEEQGERCIVLSRDEVPRSC
jgi:hypothetical protein